MRIATLVLAAALAAANAEEPAEQPLAVRLAGTRVASVLDPELHPDDSIAGWQLQNAGLDGESRVIIRLIGRGGWEVAAATTPEVLEAATDDGAALEPSPPTPWSHAARLGLLRGDEAAVPTLVTCRFRAATAPVRALSRLRLRFDARLGETASIVRATWPAVADEACAVAGEALRITPHDAARVTVDATGDGLDRLESVIYRGADGAARHVASMRWEPRDRGEHADIDFDGAVATIETAAYAKLRAIRVEATFVDVPLTGATKAPAPTLVISELPAPDLPPPGAPAKATSQEKSDF